MKEIKLLAVGNSFTENAFNYLNDFAKELNLKYYKLAYLYIGGASLELHLNNYLNNTKSYSYRVWEKDKDYKILEEHTLNSALKDEVWDIIIFQQASYVSGVKESIEPTLTKLIKIVKEDYKDVKIGFHYTWSYSKTSDHPNFIDYNNSQEFMDFKIKEVIKEVIINNKEIDFIIKSGLVITNLRKTLIGDNLNVSDGYHLNSIGDYAVGLMWIKEIFKANLEKITFKPKEVNSIYEKIIKEIVNNVEKENI